MWPFSASNILDQSIMQAMPQQQLNFGALTGGQSSPQPAPDQQQPNRTLNNPALMNALGRMGSAILIANSKGAGFGGSLGYGTQAFQDEQVRQQDAALNDQLAQAKIAKAQHEAQFGVQSKGFEGDIARSLQQKYISEGMTPEEAGQRAILETAQRLQGSWDPVNGQYAWNPKSRLTGQGASPAPAASALSDALPQPAPSQPGQTALLPPPVAGLVPDQSLFQPTGNRKTDAALQQKAGEMAMEKTAGLPKAQASFSSAAADMGNLMDTIQKAIGQTGNDTAGLGSLSSFVPGTPARDLDATLTTIRANLGFAALQEMRNNSKTGGALGAVSDAEGKKLDALKANVESSQTPAQLKANLQSLQKQTEASYQRLREAYKQDYGQYPDGPDSLPQAGELPRGVTEEDIQHTMKVHMLSRDEVLRRLQ